MIFTLSETTLRLWTELERVDRTRAPKREDHGWLYGTRYWDALTDEQRNEVLWLEHAHTISAIIWFREELLALYGRYLQKFREHISAEVHEYMSTFIEEEAGHPRMLRRYHRAGELPLYERPDLLEFIPAIERVHPIAGIFCAYIVLGMIDAATLCQDAEDLDPQTRVVMRRHHLAETRQLSFGRLLCESMLEMASIAARARASHLTRGYLGNAIRHFTFHPEILRYLSFDVGIGPNDEEVIEQIRRSPNNLRLNEERFGAIFAWVRRLGFVKPDWDWTTDARLPLAHFSRWSQNGPFTPTGKARNARLAELVGAKETP